MSVSHVLVISPVAARVAERLDLLMGLGNNKSVTDHAKRILIRDQSLRIIADINRILRRPLSAPLSLEPELMVEVNAGMKLLRIERARLIARRAQQRREAAAIAALGELEPVAA